MHQRNTTKTLEQYDQESKSRMDTFRRNMRDPFSSRDRSLLDRHVSTVRMGDSEVVKREGVEYWPCQKCEQEISVGRVCFDCRLHGMRNRAAKRYLQKKALLPPTLKQLEYGNKCWCEECTKERKAYYVDIRRAFYLLVRVDREKGKTA